MVHFSPGSSRQLYDQCLWVETPLRTMPNEILQAVQYAILLYPYIEIPISPGQYRYVQ